jgi:hypothetical protein
MFLVRILLGDTSFHAENHCNRWLPFSFFTNELMYDHAILHKQRARLLWSVTHNWWGAFKKPGGGWIEEKQRAAKAEGNDDGQSQKLA